MKKITIYSLSALTFALGLAACGNNSDSTASTDSTTTATSTATTTQTSTHNYAARADSFRTNSKAGYYLDPRTGKSINLSIDTTSGAVTDVATGRPVTHYVDKRTWWVYNAGSGDTVGSARMESGQLRYRGDNEKWMTYDERWHDTDTMNGGNNMGTNNMGSNNNNTGTSGSGDESSMNNSSSGTSTSGTGTSGDLKKLKIKTDDQKIKVTKEGVKVKPE